MKRIAFLAIFAFAFALNDVHALDVFACEPEWGSLVHELAGDKVDVDVGTTALQDVHVIEAKPSLIAKVRRADLVGLHGGRARSRLAAAADPSGRQSESAVGPGLLHGGRPDHDARKADRHSIARWATSIRGQPAFPDGSVSHPRDRQSARRAARRARSENAAAYQQNLATFTTKWNEAIKRWEAKAAPLKGRKVVVHHWSWIYLDTWLGMEQIGALEPKPGVPPTRRASREPRRPDQKRAHARDSARGLSGSEARRLAQRAHGRARGDAAVHGRRRRAVEGSVRFVRLDDRQARRGGEMTFEGLELSILGPACVAACSCSRRTCRSGSRCSRAGSSSSTLRLHKSQRSA